MVIALESNDTFLSVLTYCRDACSSLLFASDVLLCMKKLAKNKEVDAGVKRKLLPLIEEGRRV